MVLPDFPTISLGTWDGAKEKVMEVMNPLEKANKIILMQTKTPKPVD